MHQQQQLQQPHQMSALYQRGSSSNYGPAGSNDSSSLRLSYVTERILASILPARRARNGTTTGSTTSGSPGFVDEHERELIEMLEQKHEKVLAK